MNKNSREDNGRTNPYKAAAIHAKDYGLVSDIALCYLDYSSGFKAQHWREVHIHAADMAGLLGVSTGIHRQDASQMKYSQSIQSWIQVAVAIMPIPLRNSKDEQQPKATGYCEYRFLQSFSHEESTTSYVTSMQKHSHDDPAQIHQ